MSEPAISETARIEPSPPHEARAYKLVIFDFDGTLADTYEWFSGVVNDVADRYGFKRIELHDVETVRRMSARQALKHVGLPAWKLPFVSRHMRQLAARDVDGMRLFSGIETLLIELDRRGVLLAAVSSNSEENVRRVLGPLAYRFRCFACGAALFRKARRLRRVMKLCGVRPAETLSIGDEIRDLEAARKAGCDFGAVSWGYTRIEAIEVREPDFVFGNPAAIATTLAGGQA